MKNLNFVYPRRSLTVAKHSRKKPARLALTLRPYRFSTALPHLRHAPYGESTDPQGKASAAVNVRCLEGVDLTTLPVQHVDEHKNFLIK